MRLVYRSPNVDKESNEEISNVKPFCAKTTTSATMDGIQYDMIMAIINDVSIKPDRFFLRRGCHPHHLLLEPYPRRDLTRIQRILLSLKSTSLIAYSSKSMCKHDALYYGIFLL